MTRYYLPIRLLCVFWILLSSCQNQQITSTDNAGGPAKRATGVQVRYRNLSNTMFKHLQVDINDKRFAFTDIKPDSTTLFIKVTSVYPYHYARVITNYDTLIFQPVDFVGEPEYTSGFMTLNLKIDTLENGQRQLAFERTAAPPVRDYHTTASDVVDNLFIFINHQEWDIVDQFYAADAKITDKAFPNPGKLPSDYFRQLLKQHNIFYIYQFEQRPMKDGIYAKAQTRRGSLSVETPICFEFIIKENQITEQRVVECR